MGTLNKVFAVRGLLAFLAFIEFVNCSRSLLPRYDIRYGPSNRTDVFLNHNLSPQFIHAASRESVRVLHPEQDL